VSLLIILIFGPAPAVRATVMLDRNRVYTESTHYSS